MCSACGAPTEVGQRFCSECGTEINPSASVVRAPGDSEVSEQKSSDCLTCGEPLEPGASFCIQCGEAATKPQIVRKPEPIIPDEVPTNAGVPGAAGFLGALWGSSAGCGCGCFSLILGLGFLVLLGALL